MAPHVRELTDLPECEPNTSCGSAFLAHRTAFVIYETRFRVEQRSRLDAEDEDGTRFAVVRLLGCTVLDPDGPNDEALHNHPCYGFGLKHYVLQEVVESPWIAERARTGHKDGRARAVEDQRHFLFAFKDNSIDCIAASYELLGAFPSEHAAESVVREHLSASE